MSLLSGWCWLGRFALDSTLSLLIFGNVHISFLFLGLHAFFYVKLRFTHLKLLKHDHSNSRFENPHENEDV